MTDTPADSLVRVTILLEQLSGRVATIDQRLQNEFVTAKELQSIDRSVAEIKTTIKDGFKQVSDDAESTERGFRELYVTKDQFDPVRRLVYGLVTIILTGVVGALLTLVMRQGG